MSYSDKIQETQQATFAELYEFTTGLRIDRYTSHIANVVYLGETYLARPIKRSDFSLSENMRSQRLRINAPIDENLAKYVAQAPVEPVQVLIIRVFLDTFDSYELFTGEIVDVTLSANAAVAVCENNTELFQTKIPPLLYQARCNHMVFDDNCGLAEIDWQVDAVVTVSGSDLVSATFAGYADGYFTGGHVKASTDQRLITNHVGNTITLHIPFPASTLETGDVVEAWPGCDRSADTCQNKFSNFDQFLGFPYIPSSNPTVWGFK